MAKVKPQELDMIVVGTTSPDMVMPNTGALVQKNLGARNAFAFDVYAACSGFVYGLTIADKFIKEKPESKMLVIGAELLSSITDWQDRNTCVLFGDAAGAALVSGAREGDRGILSTHLRSDGCLWELLYIPGGGCLYPPSAEMAEKRDYCIRMQGNEVFKMAVNTLGRIVDETLAANHMDKSDVDWLIPHQANIRIIQATARKLRMSMDRVVVTVDEHGNTSAASVPLALDVAVRDGRIKRGETLLLEAFGGGFTWGSALIKY
jgi:3-oxoacyl-[acyl-carrier-protein] synthase-3